MNPIECLYAELDQWNFSGVEAVFWWRDDDAQSDTSALDQLIGLANRYNISASLAVIPQPADGTLQKTVATHQQLQILQHGFAHTNHAPSNEKKQELGAHRDLDTIVAELSNGYSRLQKMFGEQFVPVLVPPWNRIDRSVIPRLSEIGLLGLSCDGPRPAPEVANNIWAINTHADIINWKQGKRFIGQQVVVDLLVSHLTGKREGKIDDAEPTGLLTHHLVHDQECWEFLDELFAAMDDHPAVTWLSAQRVFQTNWR